MADEFSIPELQGRPLTLDEYHGLSPEKLELLDGYLLGPAAHEAQHKLLAALLKNEGLMHVIMLAPAQSWMQALRLVYPEREGEG